MPEFLANLLPAAVEAGAEAAPAALEAGAGSVAGGLGSLADLTAAGLPFGAGASELGSVATGVGSSGVSSFLDAGGALAGAGAGLGGVGGLTGLGAGVGEIGTNAAGTGVDLAGLGSQALPAASTLTSGTGLDLGTSGVGAEGGVTSVGPTAGTPATALGTAQFPTAGGAATSVAPAAAAAPAGAGPVDLTSMLSKAVGNINPLGAALGAAGLGYNIYQGQKQTASTQAIQNQGANIAGQAAELAGQGKELTSHLESGTLPPNIQAQVDQNVQAAKAKIISNYASQGMNTDPNKNSSLRQELASVDNQAKVMSGQLAQQLAQSGTNLINAGTALTGLDNNLLTTLSNIDQTQTQKIGQAIANFAAALSGNKGGVTLNLGSSKA